MIYDVCPCVLCGKPMTYQQLRECVYWLPNMDSYELSLAQYEGFEHRVAHRACWKALREKRRELIRICSYKTQEPRSLGQPV